ncbi:MAG: hypothetical protein ABI761_02810 [Saprospiraceae bacterium]
MKKGVIFSSNKIPLLILIIWIFSIGFFIWQRVNQSDRPPIYDALAYYLKARNFWENANKGFPQNPFNVNPTDRPPGTVLLSYPLGFEEDHHGFLFRSVFIPFLLWIIVILFIVWPKQNEGKKNSFWPALLYVFLLGPLPFFFQFDYGRFYWGLVDSFFAAMSALSLMVIIKSIEKRSLQWLIAAIFLTMICPMIKPMGYLIFLLIGIFWAIINLSLILDKNNSEKKAQVKYWWFGVSLFFLAGIIVLYLGVSSQYLGQATLNLNFMGMEILRSDTKEYINFINFLYTAYEVVGPQFAIYFFLFILLLFRYRKSFPPRLPTAIVLITGLFISLLGIWIWIWETGISQSRYFYPFFLLSFVLFLYYSNEMLTTRKIQIHSFIKGIFNVVCFLPALNILALLSQTNPNKKWQDFSGTGMSISLNNEAIEIAKKFLTEINTFTSPAMIYSIYSKENISFENYGYYYKTIHPDIPGFNCLTPIDWLRPHEYRIHELINRTDYIIYNPNNIEMPTKDYIPYSFYEEGTVIEAFLNTLSPEQGLQSIIQEKNCKLAKITNKIKLRQAFESFLLSRQWSKGFLQENKISSNTWGAYKEPYQGIPDRYTKDTSTLFNGSIEMINEIYPAKDTIQTNDIISLSGWLVYDPVHGIKADEVFIAVTSPDGNIQYWPTNSLPRLDKVNEYHQPTLLDVGYTALIDLKGPKGNYTLMLALGYQGKLIHCESLKRTIYID